MSKLYQAMRPLLFAGDPETMHHLALRAVDWQPNKTYPDWADHKPIKLMGLSFPNPIGLAAGFDNHAAHLPGLFHFGFGFIEVGGITPKAQSGNPKPRLFRLPQQQSLLNRMGFCNQGVDHLIENLKNRPKNKIVGVNICKNTDTSLNDAAKDYMDCFTKVAPYCDYVTVNISSPNMTGLRDLQHSDYCRDLLQQLKQGQKTFADQYHRYIPLWVKIAPDLSEEEVKALAHIFCHTQIDAVVTTNTTIARDTVPVEWQDQKGGISGKALTARADAILAQFYALLGETIPLIGVGGIMSLADAKRKLEKGAKLLQVYTGLIYQGPGLIKDIVTQL